MKSLEPITAIYASPLRRAMQTAGAITAAIGVPPQPRPGLKEMNLGEAERLTIPEMEARWPGLMAEWVTGRPDVRLPGGESMRGFYARVLRALQAVVSRHSGTRDRVVIVSHIGAINTMFSYLQTGTANSWFQGIGNCSVTHLELSGGPALPQVKTRAIVVGDMRHLGKAYEPWAAIEAVTGTAV